MGVSQGLPLRIKSNLIMPARSPAPLGPRTNSELSTDSRAHIRQQPHTAQPLSPSPHPHSLNYSNLKINVFRSKMALHSHKKNKRYSLSWISIRSHRAQTTYGISSAFSANSANHAHVVSPCMSTRCAYMLSSFVPCVGSFLSIRNRNYIQYADSSIGYSDCFFSTRHCPVTVYVVIVVVVGLGMVVWVKVVDSGACFHCDYGGTCF